MRFRPSGFVLVALLASAGTVNLDATAASAATTPTLRWEATAAAAKFAWGSPAIGDVNNDGSNDVVIGGEDGKLYAYDDNGASLPGHWPGRATSAINSTPALYGVNGSGQMDIFLGGDATANTQAVNDSFNGGVFRRLHYNGTNQLQEIWERHSNETFQSGAAIGDIDGDGRMEVVTGAGAF